MVGNTYISFVRIFSLWISFFIVFLFFVHTAYAAVGINAQIPFSAELNTAKGKPVTGKHNMVFRIYDAPTNGTVLWTGNYNDANENPVYVANGIFSVMLGSGTGNELTLDFNDDSYYLGVTIDTDPEMTPRERLGASGYAINAGRLDGLDSESFVRKDQASYIVSHGSDPTFFLDQEGTGNIMSAFNSSEEVFTIVNNGNIGIGDVSPSARLSVSGNVRAKSISTYEDVINSIAGTIDVLSADTSRFTGNVQMGNGSGILFGGGSDGISLYQDVETAGVNSLMIGLRGDALSDYSAKIISPGGLSFFANGSPLDSSPGQFPLLSLNQDGGVSLENTSYGLEENRYFKVSLTNGVRVTEGNLIVEAGNVGIGDIEPTSRLSVMGGVKASSIETSDDVMNTFTGPLTVMSGDNSYFGGNLYIHDGSGLNFGSSVNGGITISQDIFASGANNLIFTLRGDAQTENSVNIVVPGSISLKTNSDEFGAKFTLSEDGSAHIYNDTSPYNENHFFEINFSNGVQVVRGNLILSGGLLGVGTDNPQEALDVVGSIQSSDLVGAVSVSVDPHGKIIPEFSDRRLKKNIRTINDALEIVRNLRGVRYEWKDAERFGSASELGFVAQELQQVLPEVVHDNGEYLSVNTRNIIAVVVEALKELDTKVESYFSRTERLEQEVKDLRSEIDLLKGTLQNTDGAMNKNMSSNITSGETISSIDDMVVVPDEETEVIVDGGATNELNQEQ